MSAGIDPADMWALAEVLPYRVELSWARHTATGAFDAVLVRRDQPDPRWVRWPEASPAPAALANDPLGATYKRHLVPQLQASLKLHLPDFMVPASISIVPSLPLTPNGKLDRKALPVPEFAQPRAERSVTAPRTALEQVMAGIWAEVLGLDRIDVHDNFFELGGHSLLVIQVMVRLREAFQFDLPFRSLFITPTVAGLSEVMVRLSVEAERRAELLVALAQLSDDEVAAQLAQAEAVTL